MSHFHYVDVDIIILEDHIQWDEEAFCVMCHVVVFPRLSYCCRQSTWIFLRYAHINEAPEICDSSFTFTMPSCNRLDCQFSIELFFFSTIEMKRHVASASPQSLLQIFLFYRDVFCKRVVGCVIGFNPFLR